MNWTSTIVFISLLTIQLHYINAVSVSLYIHLFIMYSLILLMRNV